MILFPGVAPDNQQPLEASEGGHQEQNSPENTSSAPQVVLVFIGKACDSQCSSNVEFKNISL